LENNDLQQALDFANTVESKRGDDEEVAEMISSIREDIFGKNPQAKIAYLEKQVEQSPDSTQLLTELFNAYNRQGSVQKASELSSRLMKMEPSAETVRQIAQMHLEDGRPEDALQAYERAEEQGAELKAEDYFNRGTAYQKMGELARAREDYRKAIDMKDGFGRAYIAIGDLYARAVNQCSGSEMARNDRAVYWAAVDKYRQAKRIDSSIASTADNKIQTYRGVFPSKEDIFYREDWKSGQSFTIDYGCYSWIGETTSVRSAPSSG
ncbi:MAG: tetratricopeptide repeat protein, partial [Salinibacter sp.]